MRDEIRQVLRYALIIAMLAVLVLVFSGAEGEICEKAKDTAAKDCSAHNIVLVALWQIGAFLDRWSAAIVAIATVVVAGFTGTLYRATRQLSLAAEQQKIDLGAEPTTGFYREYNPSEVRFRNTDHPDFEYND